MENNKEEKLNGIKADIRRSAFQECLPDKHKQRDNKFGVTWCVKCGRLFTKPCGKPLLESDKVVWHCAQRLLKYNTMDDRNDYSKLIEQDSIKGCKFSRVWAMPSAWTFTIQPIAKLISRYVGDGKGWIDPFAGENSPAEITNDLNPVRPAKFHFHAKDFATQLEGKYRGVLFDPPYSLRQTKECYDGIGYGMTMEDTQSFPNNVKDILATKIETGGIAICFGWNSGGFGKNLGFEMIEVLLVPHGGHHSDTIVTVERKFTNEMF